MNPLTVTGLAVGLAMDALAVSIVVGLTLPVVTPRHVFRLAFHFGLFQFLMPVLGAMAGRELLVMVADFDHWVAFGLLAAVGGKMLWESCCSKPVRGERDPTRGLMLVSLSLATSLDALAVGVSMALVGTSPWRPAVIIGLVAGGFSTGGILFGRRLGARCGRWAEAAGGIVLLAIGARILLAHLLA